MERETRVGWWVRGVTAVVLLFGLIKYCDAMLHLPTEEGRYVGETSVIGSDGCFLKSGEGARVIDNGTLYVDGVNQGAVIVRSILTDCVAMIANDQFVEY